MGNLPSAILMLLACLSASNGQKIVSTGQHYSEEFLWDVGTNNLSFSINFTGFACSNFSIYTHDWKHVSTTGVTLASFRTQFRNSSFTVICYNGTNWNNLPYVSSYGIDYRIECSLVDSTLNSQFTIVSPLNSFYNGSTVKVEGNLLTDSVELVLEYCQDLVGKGRLTIYDGVNKNYSSVTEYICHDSILVVNNNYDNNTSYYRTCNYDAKWSDQGTDVDCWYAPEVNVGIEQGGVESSGTVVSEDDYTVICKASVAGNPAETNVMYHKNGVQITSSQFSVTSSDNGANLSCQMLNSYVTEVDSSAGFSRPISLDVLYQPEPLDDEVFKQSQNAIIGKESRIVILFNANPRLDVSNTALYINGKQLDSSNAILRYNGTMHEYTFTIKQISEENIGTYILSATSPSPKLAGRVTNFTVEVKHQTTGLSIVVIVAISVCVVLVVVVISGSVLLFFCRSRKPTSVPLSRS